MLPRMTVHTFRADLIPCWHADGGQPRHLHFSVILTALWPEVDWPYCNNSCDRRAGGVELWALISVCFVHCRKLLSYRFVCLHSRRTAVHAHKVHAGNNVLHVISNVDCSPFSSHRSMQTSQKRLLLRLSRGWHYRYSYYELKRLNSFGEIVGNTLKGEA